MKPISAYTLALVTVLLSGCASHAPLPERPWYKPPNPGAKNWCKDNPGVCR